MFAGWPQRARLYRQDVRGVLNGAIGAYAEYCPTAADVVAAQATVAADKILHPIPVTEHIDGVGGLLNDGIAAHKGESVIRFRSRLSTWSKRIWSVHKCRSRNLRPAINPQSAGCFFWTSATTVSFR
jgi:hypothetical protein